MENKFSDKEHELKAQKRDIESQLDELNYYKRRMQQRENDEDFDLTISCRRLGEMKICCDSNAKKLLALIEEKEQIIHIIKRNKDDFLSNFEFEIKKRKQQLEQGLEDVQMQLTSIQNQEKQPKQFDYS